MSFVQRLITSVVPRSWAQSMEAQSRAWMARCGVCGGQERSTWDLGGVRWKASGSPRTRLPCPHCGRRTWHQLRKA